MEYKKSQPRSIDGFSTNAHSSHRKPALSPQSLSNFKRPEAKRPIELGSKPLPRVRPSTQKPSMAPINKVPTTYANTQQSGGSLLNMNIPNPSYSDALSGPKAETKSKSKAAKKPWSRKRKVWTTILVIVVLLGGTFGYFGSKIIGSLDKAFHGNIFSDAEALFSHSDLKGQSTGRVNILLAGDSSDQIGHGGADLTDSILLLSIDTKNNTAFLLSIPRDLWVNIPGVGLSKINAANNGTGTNFPGYPQNGMGQLEHIVTTDLGIPIDYYALSDYGAFQDAVNAVGGVTIDVQSPDPRGLYDPGVIPRIPNGPYFLNGTTALGLARARGDQYGSYGFPDSDFDRTAHQRQIFTAVTEKAKTVGVLTNPVKVTALFNTLGNNIETNLSLKNVLSLISLTKGYNLEAVKSYSYCSTITVGQDGCTTPLLTDYTDPVSGQEALVPVEGMGDYGGLKAFYEELVSSNPVTKEGASIEVLNATNVTGLAKQAENSLQTKGAVNVAIADSNVNYSTSMIIDNAGANDTNTLSALQKMIPYATVVKSQTTPEAEQAANYTHDNFVVVLGQDFANSNPVASNTAGSNTGGGSSTSNQN